MRNRTVKPSGSSVLVKIACVGDTRDIVPRRKLRFVVTPVAGSVVTVATGAGEASATQFLPDQIAYLMPQ